VGGPFIFNWFYGNAETEFRESRFPAPQGGSGSAAQALSRWLVAHPTHEHQKIMLGCFSDWFKRSNDLDCWRASRWRKAFRCARGWKADSVSGTGSGDSRITAFPPLLYQPFLAGRTSQQNAMA